MCSFISLRGEAPEGKKIISSFDNCKGHKGSDAGNVKLSGRRGPCLRAWGRGCRSGVPADRQPRRVWDKWNLNLLGPRVLVRDRLNSVSKIKRVVWRQDSQLQGLHQGRLRAWREVFARWGVRVTGTHLKSAHCQLLEQVRGQATPVVTFPFEKAPCNWMTDRLGDPDSPFRCL